MATRSVPFSVVRLPIDTEVASSAKGMSLVMGAPVCRRAVQPGWRPGAVAGCVSESRGEVRAGGHPRLPRAFFTEAGVDALRELAQDRRSGSVRTADPIDAPDSTGIGS